MLEAGPFMREGRPICEFCPPTQEFILLRFILLRGAPGKFLSSLELERPMGVEEPFGRRPPLRDEDMPPIEDWPISRWLVRPGPIREGAARLRELMPEERPEPCMRDGPPLPLP
jgi:hypothetical protein